MALKGTKLSEDHKRKLRLAWKSRPPISEETKLKISHSLKGRKLSEVNKMNIGLSNKGKKRSNELRERISNSLKGKMVGNENGYWKGDKVSYAGLHKWIGRKLGKPLKCLMCTKTSDKFVIQWANKSQKYTRNLDDWLSLCCSCHKKYDIHFKKTGELLWHQAQ